jgi:beta-lactamase superfamily II metal-dependent hydrolase
MRNRRPPSLLLLVLLGLALGLAGEAGARPRRTYRVHNIDVGQGSATLVQTLGGKNILFDTGWDFAGKRLVSYLKRIGVRKLDALVISHRHLDHIGGVQQIGDNFRVDKVIGPWHRDGIPTSAMVHLAHLRKDRRKGKTPQNRPTYLTATAGKVFDFGDGFSLETVWPKRNTSGKRVGDFNEESVAMRVVQKAPGGKAATFFFGGDLGVREERWLGQKKPYKLRSDWIVANHHGSPGSSQHEFMVALDGGYSRMLKALIKGPGCKDGRCYATAEKLKETAKGRYANALLRNLDPLYKGGKKPIKPGSWLSKLVREVQYQNDRDPHAANRYAVYSTGPNPYGHPNAIRMAEAQLAGFTPLTTWANGSVVMTRKLGRDGDWSGPWKPTARKSAGLPSVRMPGWLGRTDPQRPYNSDRREANGHWHKLHPHPQVKWSDPWDTSLTWRQVSQHNAGGRRDWIERYVQNKMDAQNGTRGGRQPRTRAERTRNKRNARARLKRMRYQGRREWHGLNLDGLQNLSGAQLRVIALQSRTENPRAGIHRRRGNQARRDSGTTPAPPSRSAVFRVNAGRRQRPGVRRPAGRFVSRARRTPPRRLGTLRGKP